MTINMIRHGETSANEKKLYSGYTDLKLSENGKLKLMKLKDELIYPKGDLYITSGLKRTNETLEILYNKLPDIEINELREMNFGKFEMHSHLELLNDEYYNQWLKEYPNKPCKNGESVSEFKERIKLGFNKLIELKVNNVVLISHGGVIASFFEDCYDEKRGFYNFIPHNGRGFTVILDDKKIIDFFAI